MTWPPATGSRAEFRDPRDDEPAGTRSEIITGPVTDWATDFSHLEPEWSADPYPIQDDLRQRCPIAHTRRFGGAWLPTRYADVAAIAYDTGRFSSRSIIVGNLRPPRELAPIGGSPPISSDPPFHHHARKLLLPAFTKAAVTRQEPATRAFCHALLDGFGDAGVVDAARDYAQHIPVRVIAGLLGFPPEDGPQFREFVGDLLEGINLPPQERETRVSRLFDYLLAQVDDHLDHPRDDLTSYLLDAEIFGQKLDPSHVVGTMALLLIAGIDTTWSAIGVSLWHLARAPEDRRRLAAQPGLLPAAVEEFLRAYAPVTMARLVKAGHALARRRHEGRRLDPAVVPGGQPGPGAVRPGRRGCHRPRGQPARRVRPRHPPLRRLAPGADGTPGGPGGLAGADR